MDEIVEKLKEIGLNEYQSKVYIALLKKFPATGYEISKLANIPQSRTYDTLKSLESLNIALASNSKPVTYTPIKPKELTKRYKRKIDSTINFLEKKLPSVKEEEYTEPIIGLSGKTKIIDKIIEIIKDFFQVGITAIIVVFICFKFLFISCNFLLYSVPNKYV